MKYNREKIKKFQQGGSMLPLRSFWERLLRIEPDYKPVNSEESITRYIDNTLRGPVDVSKIKKEVPYGNGSLTSVREIINPRTNKADTTYITPSGFKFDNEYIKKNPIFQSYQNKFGSYFKYQEGGTIEEDDKDQLIVDFAAELLKASGLNEEDIVDDDGGIKEEYAGLIINALKEVDTPEFWEEFKKSPTTTVENYIQSKTPEKAEYAKKGTKLKQLKSTKNRKCKCGCDLILKKDSGGTIVEVCACGCKNK